VYAEMAGVNTVIIESTDQYAALLRNLAFTLACWRSVPVLAEASVMLAAATGVPISRIFRVTLLPNLAISTVYALAADDSFATACVAFLAVFAFSMALWWLGRQEPEIVSTANSNIGDDSH